jgi:hypothetical protein
LGGGEGNGRLHYKGKQYTTKKTKVNPTLQKFITTILLRFHKKRFHI